MAATISQSTTATRLVSRVICPHCWEPVPARAGALDLRARRPARRPAARARAAAAVPAQPVHAQGDAIDARGMICQHLACPHCHLAVPRGMLEMEPLFLSILGARPAASRTSSPP